MATKAAPTLAEAMIIIEDAIRTEQRNTPVVEKNAQFIGAMRGAETTLARLSAAMDLRTITEQAAKANKET